MGTERFGGCQDSSVQELPGQLENAFFFQLQVFQIVLNGDLHWPLKQAREESLGQAACALRLTTSEHPLEMALKQAQIKGENKDCQKRSSSGQRDVPGAGAG